MQSNVDRTEMPSKMRSPAKLHVAIIMDGNGRWAARARPAATAGATRRRRCVRRVVEAAPGRHRHADPLRVLERQLAPAAGRSRGADRALRRLSRAMNPTARRNGVRLTSSAAATAAGRNRTETARAEAHIGERLRLICASRSTTPRAMRSSPAPQVTGSCTTSPARASRQLVTGGAERARCRPRDPHQRGAAAGRTSCSREIAYAELYFTNRLWPDSKRTI